MLTGLGVRYRLAGKSKWKFRLIQVPALSYSQPKKLSHGLSLQAIRVSLVSSCSVGTNWSQIESHHGSHALCRHLLKAKNLPFRRPAQRRPTLPSPRSISWTSGHSLPPFGKK